MWEVMGWVLLGWVIVVGLLLAFLAGAQKLRRDERKGGQRRDDER